MKDSLAEKILDYALSHGGDYAEIFAEDTDRTEIVLMNEKLNTLSVGKERGIGIRILTGTSCWYYYTDRSDESFLLQALKDWKSGKGNQNATWNMPVETVYQQEKKWQKAELAEKKALLERCVRAAQEEGTYLAKLRASYVDMDQRVHIIHTDGGNIRDHRMKTRLTLTAFAKDGNEQRSSFTGPGAMQGFEFYHHIKPEAYARKAVRNAEALLHARPCPTGKMPVIIANGFGGLFFHEACGHSLEADSMAYGQSEFSGKTGQKVASEKVTLVDDGTIPNGWGSLRVDDEGVPTQKNILIENGVLSGCLADRLGARKLGIQPTGSARRQSYRYAPVSRMTNTFIMPGQDKPEDMIASVDRGIYVKNINAGSVNPVTGEFNFHTKEAFLIEDGKVICPVHSATLIGTGGEILRKVEMVGDDFALDQGYCYAGSGAIYIGAGQPSVKIAEMTVGGDKA